MQHHPDGLVGRLWRIVDPKTIDIGHCFLRGRLIKDDLFFCLEHAGDYFQNYVYVWEGWQQMIYTPAYQFGSYGIGNSIELKLTDEQIRILTTQSQLRLG